MILSLIIVSNADAFRCDGNLVSTGDTKLQVLNKCGKPTVKDAWTEERISYYSSLPGEEEHKVFATVRVEEWTYNFGPRRFMYILRFSDGKLESIKSGDHGY